MPELGNGRNATKWNNTTAVNHLDAARDSLGMGYSMDSVAHSLIALVLIQQAALEAQHGR